MHQNHRALGLAAHSTAVPSNLERGIDIAKRRPADPVTLLRPHAAARAARFFVEKFPGRPM
ncbi:MAG: type III PLP-dependent enzyme, partial [Sphingomonas pseudosanguinis]